MGWLIGIFIFIVSWVVCFIFTYKVYYWDMSRLDGFTDDMREAGLFFASLHIVGVLVAIIALAMQIPSIFSNRAKTGKGLIGKFIRKLEK